MQEDKSYQEVIKCIEVPNKAVGREVPGSFPLAKEPIPGETEYAQLFGEIVEDRKRLEHQLRLDEAQEEELVNNAIKAEIGNNFKTFSSWAHQEGIMMG